MRLHACWVPLAGLAALAVAGCGASAPVIKPTVKVAITAPTNGATVGVRDVTITGTVTPATAQVLVAGQPVKVQGGSFRRTLRLDSSAQTLVVTAQAAGYAPAQANTQVSYSAGLAAQLIAASRTLAAPSPSAPVSPSAASPASASLLAQAVALPHPAPAAHRAPTNPTRAPTTHPLPAASTPAPPTPSPAHPTPSPAAPTPSPAPPTSPSPAPPTSPSPPPVSTPAPAPIPPSPAAIAARVKQQWESNCLQKRHGAKEVPYCTCIYTHLERTGAFRTPATTRALIRRVARYIRTGDASHLTRAIMRALSICQARFPASQSLGGPMSVTPLSGSHRQPATPAPVTPLPAGPRPTPISPNFGTWP